MIEKTHPSWRSTALIVLILLGLALRLAPWGQNRFLEDEALYAYWGLKIATGADPMLDEEPVDKPPLHPYTLALLFALFSPPLLAGRADGQAELETAARLPSLFASITGIVLVFALGRGLFGDERVGLLAALLLALSPFDILFASTAFTDPLMTVFILGALLAAARDRLGTAGMLNGLAAATKQQGLLFLPLVVAVGCLSPPRLRKSRALPWVKPVWRQRWVRFSLGFAIIAVVVLWWDAARLLRPGFLEQSLVSYGGLRPTEPGILGERAVEWLRLAGAFWPSPWFTAVLASGIVVWLIGGLAGWWPGGSKIDLALLLFVLSFLLLHLLVGFQVWDRYLLGLVPLVALLAARAFVALGGGIRTTRWRRAYSIGLGVLLAASLAGPALRAARSELPLGGDHGAYDGIQDLATYVRTQAPPGSVLYHYWLGYHYRFYLYGVPLRLHWYPDLEDLTRDAYVYRQEPRYIAFPSWRDGSAAETALAEAGIRLEPVFETTRRDGSRSLRLYRLEGP